jgi:exopolysaccharide biosynthesis polyprenyl glycosylphosphotransferase
VRSLQHLSADVMVLPGGSGVSESVVRISRFLHQPVFQAIERPIRDWDLWAKRALDVTLAGGALVLISPLMLLIALAIRIESRGPIIFRQIRGGMNGNTFELWKFRSMYADKADLDATVQTSKHDPRVTPVGRFIRRTSLDELPQLFNVLFGSMSLVGPRPHALNTRAQGRELEEVVDYYASRHRVKPGITGWAQVNGFRGELDTFDKVRQRVDLDLAYIEKWSLWLDVKILLRTFLLIVHDPRAY